MSKELPQTQEAITAEFGGLKNNFNYFSLMLQVSRSRGTNVENIWCQYARRVMLALGYPAEVKKWSDEQMLNYADNLVAIG
jgi:hypothetical protein